ncbi:MFS transporter [Mycobacterium haemophilum]|uniref:Major facilitator transporter n=1 Tax=Mycobacterium haemophilum TaxID=29311 RepID=A0A0I9UTP8_9MYCO|nr:MFS transporter [Mycobacterium haemophilum]KLO26322.1 major facilitator transporter [Mycobacterium haemophilum]KLO34581.1 major facilitator transporter [Mycobacterium haemophilum]KLO40901.1 major facilitator transporter [Mycobacterium haemophilum]KLO46514.1 major facilitator transporter [Mycobacterium haemophilum]
MKRVALASLIGSAIEFYDFFLYGTAAALVFPSVFFANLAPTMATIASLATFAAAFFSRPLGAAILGHFGDRLGRKATLVATLLIMGLSTVAVGLLPGVTTIGVAAPLVLLTLRLLQGIALGGEWAGSALLVAEHAPGDKRGHYGMVTPLGAGVGLVLANVAMLAVNFTIGETSPAFMSWGWRVPFLLSAVLVVVALYMRLNIAETPVFALHKLDEPADTTVLRAPITELFRTQLRQVVLAAGCAVGLFALSFMAGTYLMNYARTELGHSRDLILFVGALGGLSMVAFVVPAAVWSDRFGRRRIMLCGFVVSVPWAFVVMPLMDTGDSVLFGVAIAVTYAIVGALNGPLASFIPETFATRYRYTGAGLTFNAGGIIGGAVPPMIAGALAASVGGWAVGLMMAVLILTSLGCTFLLPETRGNTLMDSKIFATP